MSTVIFKFLHHFGYFCDIILTQKGDTIMNKCSIDYGNFIKERRTKMGLTQEEVAKRLGISQVAYGRYELGLREPNFSLILKISEALEFAPGEFFDNYEG